MFNERLRDLRKEKGITQKEFALIADISPSNISKLESGQIEPNLKTLLLIAEYFDVTTDYLLGKSDFKKGRLAYLSHNNETEYPVHFKWQILDWDISEEQLKEIGLELETSSEIEKKEEPIVTDPPESSALEEKGQGVSKRVFRGRHINFSENDANNKQLGLAGELFIIDFEKQYLIDNGQSDLASKIFHISKIEGYGAGYDIRSFTPEGQVKHIEVKTTKGGKRTPFILTANELAFSQENLNTYYLYRVYNFNIRTGRGQFYIIQGDVSEEFILEPIQYKAKR